MLDRPGTVIAWRRTVRAWVLVRVGSTVIGERSLRRPALVMGGAQLGAMFPCEAMPIGQ